jgi:hypothetical protein
MIVNQCTNSQSSKYRLDGYTPIYLIRKQALKNAAHCLLCRVSKGYSVLYPKNY